MVHARADGRGAHILPTHRFTARSIVSGITAPATYLRMTRTQCECWVPQADLLVINKTDLAVAVGADLGVMEEDAARMRGEGPTVLVRC